MPSRTVLRTGLAAAFLFSTSLGIHAAPLRVTGTVRGEAGSVSGAQVELYPAYESYADALRRVTEKQAPAPLATARVGTGGTFELLAPEKGCFRVVVRADGYLPVEIPFLPLVDHQELPTAPLARSLPVELRTAGPDGRPLAGIEVRVPPSSPIFRANQLELSPSWQVADFRAVSDAKGQVTIPWSHFEGAPAVVSLSPRFLGQSRAAASEEVADLRLSAVRPVRIEVRDTRDQPVPQALFRWGGVPIAATGPDGRLEIAVPRDGPPLTVESHEGGQARITIPAGREGEVVPIRLVPPRRISGQVVDSKTRKPAPGALVWNGRPLTTAPVIAGKDGAFEISLSSWAAEKLEGTAPAYDFGETRIAGKTPQERVLLPLPPAMVFFGVVVDPADRPVPGTLIVANPPRIRDGVPEPISARSAEDGRFVLRNLLPNATYWLTLTRQGFSRFTGQLKTYPTGKTRLFRFVLDHGPVVKGRLVDEAGRSVAGAEVTLTFWPEDGSFEQEARWLAVSDAAGMFSFERAGTGSFSLKAVHSDHADLYLSDIEIPGGQPDVDLGTLTLAAGGTLEGKVTSVDGKPVEGAEVRVETTSDSVSTPRGARPLTVNVRTGPDGVFRARGLHAGARFYLWAWRRGYVPKSQGPFQLPQEPPVRIELKPIRGLSGRVVGPEGEPVAGATVLGRLDVVSLRPVLGDVQPRGGVDLEISNGKDKWYVSTRPDGTFLRRFADFSGTGTYTVKVHNKDLPPFETSVRIPEGGSAPPIEIQLTGNPDPEPEGTLDAGRLAPRE